jgi:hypothetical protein
MSKKIAKILTFLVALISGFISMVFVLPLGLVVPPFIIFPLALGVIALLSAIGAGWAGNLFASDQSYSRLLPVIGLTEIIAVGLAVVLGIILMLGGPVGPLIITFGLSTTIIALAATVATWRYRSAKRDLARDGLMTGGLIVLSVLIVAGVIFLASLFGLVGA